MAAEQKARSTYEYILNLTDDPDVIEPIRFLREREIVHFQRFGEALRIVQDYLDSDRQFIIPKPDFMKPGCDKKPQMDCDKKPQMDCDKKPQMDCDKKPQMDCDKKPQMDCGKRPKMDCNRMPQKDCGCRKGLPRPQSRMFYE